MSDDNTAEPDDKINLVKRKTCSKCLIVDSPYPSFHDLFDIEEDLSDSDEPTPSPDNEDLSSKAEKIMNDRFLNVLNNEAEILEQLNIKGYIERLQENSPNVEISTMEKLGAIYKAELRILRQIPTSMANQVIKIINRNDKDSVKGKTQKIVRVLAAAKNHAFDIKHPNGDSCISNTEMSETLLMTTDLFRSINKQLNDIGRLQILDEIFPDYDTIRYAINMTEFMIQYANHKRILALLKGRHDSLFVLVNRNADLRLPSGQGEQQPGYGRQFTEFELETLSAARITRYVLTSAAVIEFAIKKIPKGKPSSITAVGANQDNIECCTEWLKNIVDMIVYIENPGDDEKLTVAKVYAAYENSELSTSTILHEKLRKIGIKYKSPDLKHALLQLTSLLNFAFDKNGRLRALAYEHCVFLCGYFSFIIETIKAFKVSSKDWEALNEWFMPMLGKCPPMVTLTVVALRDMITRHIHEPDSMPVAAKALEMASRPTQQPLIPPALSTPRAEIKVKEEVVTNQPEPIDKNTTTTPIKKPKKRSRKKKWAIRFPPILEPPTETSTINTEENTPQEEAKPEESTPEKIEPEIIETQSQIEEVHIPSVTIPVKPKEKRRPCGDHIKLEKSNKKQHFPIPEPEPKKPHSKPVSSYLNNKKKKNNKTPKKVSVHPSQKYSERIPRDREALERYFRPREIYPGPKTVKKDPTTAGTSRSTNISTTITSASAGKSTAGSTTAGKSAAGSTTAGKSTAGSTIGGKSTASNTTAGKSTTSCTTAEKSTAGKSTAGSTTADKSFAGKITADSTTAGKITADSTTSEKNTAGKSTAASTTVGKSTTGSTTAEKSTSGSTTVGKNTTGNTTTEKNTAGKSTAGSPTVGKSTTGSTTAEKSTSGSTTVGKNTTGNTTTEKNTAGKSTAGSPTVGKSTTGSTTAEKSTAGKSTAGGTTSSKSTAGSTNAENSTAGSTTAEKNTAGSTTAEKGTAGSTTAGKTFIPNEKGTTASATAGKSTAGQRAADSTNAGQTFTTNEKSVTASTTAGKSTAGSTTAVQSAADSTTAGKTFTTNEKSATASTTAEKGTAGSTTAVESAADSTTAGKTFTTNEKSATASTTAGKSTAGSTTAVQSAADSTTAGKTFTTNEKSATASVESSTAHANNINLASTEASSSANIEPPKQQEVGVVASTTEREGQVVASGVRHVLEAYTQEMRTKLAHISLFCDNTNTALIQQLTRTRLEELRRESLALYAVYMELCKDLDSVTMKFDPMELAEAMCDEADVNIDWADIPCYLNDFCWQCKRLVMISRRQSAIVYVEMTDVMRCINKRLKECKD